MQPSSHSPYEHNQTRIRRMTCRFPRRAPRLRYSEELIWDCGRSRWRTQRVKRNPGRRLRSTLRRFRVPACGRLEGRQSAGESNEIPPWHVRCSVTQQPTEEVTNGADQRQSLSRLQSPGAGAGFRGRHAMTSIASSASEVKVQHRSLLIERGYEEFTGRLGNHRGHSALFQCLCPHRPKLREGSCPQRPGAHAVGPTVRDHANCCTGNLYFNRDYRDDYLQANEVCLIRTGLKHGPLVCPRRNSGTPDP
jgi:hypothetical protein